MRGGSGLRHVGLFFIFLLSRASHGPFVGKLVDSRVFNFNFNLIFLFFFVVSGLLGPFVGKLVDSRGRKVLSLLALLVHKYKY